MVGTYATLEGLYGPLPLSSGTHDGCSSYADPFHHMASLWLSQPHQGPALSVNDDGFGLSPVNPSSVAAASTKCPPHEGVVANSNVRSEMAKLRASAARFGICEGSNCA